MESTFAEKNCAELSIIIALMLVFGYIDFKHSDMKIYPLNNLQTSSGREFG